MSALPVPVLGVKQRDGLTVIVWVRARVRTRDVFIEIRGIIPGELLEVLRREYGHRLIITTVPWAPMTDVLNAPMYEPEPRPMAPGDYLRFYRSVKSLTQAELANQLGGIPRQNVGAMEAGSRPVGKRMALRLADFFGVSPSRFLDPGCQTAPTRGR